MTQWVMSGSSKGVIMGHSADCEGVATMFDKMNTYGAEFGAVSIGIGDLYTDTVGIGISFSCKTPSPLQTSLTCSTPTSSFGTP